MVLYKRVRSSLVAHQLAQMDGMKFEIPNHTTVFYTRLGGLRVRRLCNMAMFCSAVILLA